MTRQDRTGRNHGFAPGQGRPSRRRPAALLTGLVLPAALLLAGCGSSEPADPTGVASSLPAGHPAPSNPAGTDATTTESPRPQDAADLRPDQRAAQAAAARAAELGFTQARAATDEQIAALRQDARQRATNTTGTTVDPAQCKPALRAVDWSPLVEAGTAATRVDVFAEGFAGAGTVEVVALEDPSAVDRQIQDISTLVQDCASVQVTLDERLSSGQTSRFTLVSSVPGTAEEAPVDAALLWSRTEAGSAESAADSLVVMGRQGDHVVMVSFLGTAEVADPEFTTMAEQMLTAALAEL